MIERDDIPKRLREQSVGDYSVSLWDEAADEIDRLRAENAQLTAEVAALKAQADLPTEVAWLHNATLRAEVATLKAERDEARWEICELRADLRVNPTFKRQVAAERGWDCFDAKEAKP